jgi:low affinity Fe/Cu permease
MQIKLDELIRVTSEANTALLDLEELSDDELDATRAEYERLAKEAREKLRERKPDPS